MLLAVSALIIYKKEFAELSDTINNNLDIMNWEVVDEGFHKLNKMNVNKLREIASTRDIEYTVHAPFSSVNLAEADTALRNMFMRFMKESLTNAYKLEAKIWVLHSGRFTPLTYFFPEKAWEAHNSSLLELSKEARNLGIRIAVENMLGEYELFNSAENGSKILDNVKSENIGLCFDIGHANLLGNIDSFLEVFSDEIIHVHVHDNDGKEDSHLPVGKGNIKWKSFLDWLEKVRYKGWVVFENYELSDVKQGMEFLANSNIIIGQ